MSAKYLNKKKKPYLLLALIMAVAAVVIFMITVKTTEEPATADPAQVEQAKQTQPEEVLQTSVTLVELPINLGEGLVITNISSYAGL